jgi:excisionase family DNA binding protein
MSNVDGIAQLAAQLAQLVQTLAEQNHQPIETAAARAVPERTLLTAEEAADRLGIGRTFMFKLIRTGEITSVQIGRLRRVPASAIQEYAARLVNTSTQNRAA